MTAYTRFIETDTVWTESEARFDLPPLNPNQPVPEPCEVCGKYSLARTHFHDGIGGCEWCCPICENERLVVDMTREIAILRSSMERWKLRYEAAHDALVGTVILTEDEWAAISVASRMYSYADGVDEVTGLEHKRVRPVLAGLLERRP